MNPEQSSPVSYYDRYAKSMAQEAIYGDGWLRWTYGNPLGRLTAWLALRRAWFSVVVGSWMNTRSSARRIPSFIERFGIDMSQFKTPAGGWQSFNEFFSRKLACEARPIDRTPGTAILPSDGRHMVYPDRSDLSGLVVKGQPFTLEELLGDRELAENFEEGSMIVSRLCPTDYHRFHFPVAGMPSPVRRIHGRLDSVSPVAIKAGARCLCANKRELSLLQSPEAGLVAIIEVGAACVGRIVQTFEPGSEVGKGDEKGFFLFGGSTVITLFKKGRMRFSEDLIEQSAKGIETYARMGDAMGSLTMAQARRQEVP